ncbi:BnaC04g26630D [Brassica napus]|uniref:(rape) hypothetical protein n=1 Tax=Brassica napus TaxID=3708 RepID=A0A078FJJ7_BRANA|nr:unnamed protein product [Brassica napus]CDY13172.1 BnaC04g26630D [Brassica napus]
MTPVMCNPASGEFITLPEVKEILPYPKTYCGYDPTDKQFKVLCVSANSASTRAHVLTLKTGKYLWRMIECTPHHTVVSRGICIDGVFYDHAYSAVDYMIVCFNVRSEKFSYIKIDDESINGACTLINYKGKLREFSLQIPVKEISGCGCSRFKCGPTRCRNLSIIRRKAT